MNMAQASSHYFEQVAGQWDDLRSGFFTVEVRQAAIAKAYLRPEMVVADVGAGTGFMAAGLAPLVSKVHVLDGSTAMLSIARQNLSAFSNIEYHLAESRALPLPDGSMDAVFANMYLHHCPDPAAAIREMVRLLKPGGRLVITDLDQHSHTWMKEEMADEWLGFEREQVRGWLQSAGLVNAMIDCTGQNCCAEKQKTVEQTTPEKAEISVFVASGTKRIQMRSLVKRAYSKAVETASCCGSKSDSSCCGDASATEKSILAQEYDEKDLDNAPEEAQEVFFGCGNPIAMAKLKPGEVVLDIGSGGGMDAFIAARRVAPSGRVIGVDMTPAMIHRARSSAKRAEINNVEFRLGQAEELPVEDNSVDVVISNCVINLVEDKFQAFSEIHRVLKSGGRLEISDTVTTEPMSLNARLDAAAWAGCISGALCEQEYLDLISQAGFKDIQARRGPVSGELDGSKVYSIVVSAIK